MSSREAVWSAVVLAERAGLCVVPPAQDGSKKPGIGSWKRYRSERPTMAQLEIWYSGPRSGIGVVCGSVSGGIEALDFDDRSVFVEFGAAARAAGLGELVDELDSGYCEHSPNGAHWLYFCDAGQGNTKLATRKGANGRRKSIIETRGEGGYIIIAPSYGGINADGAYELQGGGLESIPVISADQRTALHGVARLFDDGAPSA